MRERVDPLGPWLRGACILLLLYPLLIALAILYDWPWASITIAVLWVAVAAWDRGRTRLGALLLVLPLGLGPLVLWTGKVDEPCGGRIYATEVRTAEAEYRDVPPHRVCRVEYDDGRVEHVGGPVSLRFLVGFGWWTLALWAVLAVRPRWPVRYTIAGVTWLPATLYLGL